MRKMEMMEKTREKNGNDVEIVPNWGASLKKMLFLFN
jgi:hypothetical protein